MKGYEVNVGVDDAAAAVGGRGLQGSVKAGAVNTAAVAEESHNMLAFGTSLGTVEFSDPRSRRQVGVLARPGHDDFFDGHQEITALEFDQTGLGIATGSSAGIIHLYDLRSPKPVLRKDQGYGYPIQDIVYLSSRSSTRAQMEDPKILSSDKRIIKIWDARDGSPWTSVEPAVDINRIAWCKDSGMILTANEGKQQHAFFVPKLGPAPRWCSFLDNLVEEMAEDSNDPNAFQSHDTGEVYDNYKFLTIPQLETLNLSHLIGTTGLLRPYMHGYFVAQRLYEEAKLIADPFIFEEERNKRVKNKIDAEREGRIRGNKKATVKVNKRLAEKLMEKQEKTERRQAKKVIENGGDQAHEQAHEKENIAETESDLVKKPDNLLTDPRFARLFQDEAFAIDEHSREFQQLNPSTKPASPSPPNGTNRKLTAVEEDMLDEIPESSASSSAASEPDSPKAKKQPADTHISTPSYRKSGHRPRQPTMQVSSSKQAEQRMHDRSFGERAQDVRSSKPRMGNVTGEKQITFAPERKRKRVSVVAKPERKSNKDRRSASGNVFRNL